ncbi:MAG: GerMN domain-containing protein [Desulfobacterales bacterium]|nr:GerMN domain-containing protein [Desulfobacterales bacterium]
MSKFPGHRTRRKPGLRLSRQGIAAMVTLMMMPAIGLLTSPCLWAQRSLSRPEPDRPATARAVTISLYFADNTRFALLAEQRQLPRPDNPVAFGRTIIRELAAGPRGKHLGRALPDGDILRSFFIASDRTAYVDLSREMWTYHPGGVQADVLAIYSMINSLVLNMAEIDAVKILSLGRELSPAAGHLDLRYPLKANILLIR